MNQFKDLEDMVDIFHDAGITDFCMDKQVTFLKIEILYLAEMIDSGLEAFFLQIHNLEKCDLNVFENERKYTIKDLPQICELESEVLNCEILSSSELEGHWNVTDYEKGGIIMQNYS